jgi:hypothetical protein
MLVNVVVNQFICLLIWKAEFALLAADQHKVTGFGKRLNQL